MSEFHMDPLEHIISPKDAGSMWGLSEQYVKNLCREGKVRAKKIGKQWVIDVNQPNPKQYETKR